MRHSLEQGGQCSRGGQMIGLHHHHVGIFSLQAGSFGGGVGDYVCAFALDNQAADFTDCAPLSAAGRVGMTVGIPGSGTVQIQIAFISEGGNSAGSCLEDACIRAADGCHVVAEIPQEQEICVLIAERMAENLQSAHHADGFMGIMEEGRQDDQRAKLL